MRYRHRGKVEV